MKIMMVGDVFGRPGRKLFSLLTPRLKSNRRLDLVVANGENVSHGRGISRAPLDELYRGGADVVTSGNHIWDNKEVFSFIDDEPYLIRPANFPPGNPGKGWCIYDCQKKRVAVVNLIGRTFMQPVDCPFQKIEDVLRESNGRADIILVDFHAEATSEKIALGFYLDGRVTALVGTHTHVQTADERLLPKGTAFITDLGMTGPINSIIGDTIEPIIFKFTTGRPSRFAVTEDGPCIYSAVVIDVDDNTNRAKSIERVLIKDSDD